MKTLYLIRHAKSSWKDESLKDHKRPLAERGIDDANLIGNFLKKNDIAIDLFMISSAVRTRMTAQIIGKYVQPKQKDINSNLYVFHDNGDAILKEVINLEDYQSVAVFGHNETFANLAYRLSHKKVLEFPTCSCLAVSFPIEEWKNISIEMAKLDFYVKPKMLRK